MNFDMRSTTNSQSFDGTVQESDLGLLATQTKMMITQHDGSLVPLDIIQWKKSIEWASKGYEDVVSTSLIIEETLKNVFNGITAQAINDALVLGAVSFIEQDPAYGFVAARLLLKKLFKNVTRQTILQANSDNLYALSFVESIKKGIEHKILAPELAEFDLEYLARNIRPERDNFFDYMGLKTLYERYFTKLEHDRLELPQYFWMRVAMGLSLFEPKKNERAVEFYNVMSNFRYIPSTPTLLHSGLVRPQLSSCFLNTVEDDLKHIFKCLGDNAQMSKWSGGLGTDWTNVRATGAMINSIKTDSQGLIPFLKISNAVTAAINRSGSRRAAACVYLETWHLDIEDFLDLRRNTGDERRRAHDINTANWIPDLFMKRVMHDGEWTLFSPEEVPDLHHIYGRAFDEKYEQYEAQTKTGQIKKYKVISANALWRKMLSRLFETGHPWITFKDPSNIRSPQDHVGVVHNSNLCTEIILNNSKDETAVCNIGSINLARHIAHNTVDYELLCATIKTAMRILDNVIDINFYPTKEGEDSNKKHRPVGLGVMGLQDAMYQLDISWNSERAQSFSDETMEQIAYCAILGSSELAKERGFYGSYKGSKWDRGLLPQDTIELLEHERGMKITVSRSGKLDWMPVREHIKKYGMRNSNTMAIAPTATISNIAGCFPCIEPIYKNIYVKANMSGEFTVVNKYLIEDLKQLNLWNKNMLDQLKYYDGNVSKITAIPSNLKDKYKEAFEIDPERLIHITAARSKWIDQSQSHNVFMQGVSGKKLDAIYKLAWQTGLKTTYYLRTLGATQIEKSTLDAKKFGFTQKREYGSVEVEPSVQTEDSNDNYIKVKPATACNIMDNADCESCQ